MSAFFDDEFQTGVPDHLDRERQERHRLVAPAVLTLLLLIWYVTAPTRVGPVVGILPIVPLGLAVARRWLRRSRWAAGLDVVLPFASIGLVSGFYLDLGWSDPNAPAIALSMTAGILLLTGRSAARSVTLSVAVFAALSLCVVSLVHQRAGLVVACPALLVLIAHVVSSQRADVNWLRRQTADTQQRLDLAVTNGHAGLFEVDLRTLTAHYSPRFREVLGYDGFASFPPLPTSLESSALIHEADQPALNAVLSICQNEGAPFDLQCRLLTAAGRPLWVRMRGSVHLCDTGRPSRLVGSIVDISARKQADQLAESFLLAASTRIRAPLTSIRGVHRLVTGGAFGPLPELATRMLSIAERNSARLETLIDQLIDLRRMDRDAPELCLQTVDLVDVVRDATLQACDAHDDLLVFHPTKVSQPVLVRADRLRLVNALTALLLARIDDLTVTADVHVALETRGDVTLVRIVRSASPDDEAVNQHIADALSSTISQPGMDFANLGLTVSRASVAAMGGMLQASYSSTTGLELRLDFEACADVEMDGASTMPARQKFAS